MYRDRIENTEANSLAAKQLKTVMIAYHDFQRAQPPSASACEQKQLTEWQSRRLMTTHHDLYTSKEYTTGLAFLLSQLYAPEDFSARDRDLERIFPKLVRWLPDSVLETVSTLVELNLLTQTLDKDLSHALFNTLAASEITEQRYCEAYRECDNYHQRLKQLTLVEQAGKKLEKYSKSSIIHYSLKLSKSPAEKAGLGALHQFIKSGFEAFHSMDNVDKLMTTLVRREQTVLNNIFQGRNDPFDVK